MAYKVEWTAQAIEGHDEIIHYLESNFTDEEIQSFVNETYEFIELLKIYPFLLQKSNQKKRSEEDL